jgi:hypothetical protein
MRRAVKKVLLLVVVLLLVLVSACNPTAERSNSPRSMPADSPQVINPSSIFVPVPAPTIAHGAAPVVDSGTIEFLVTDPPPADVIHAFVTLSTIEIHRQGGGWEQTAINETTFDLMEVIGVTEVLGSVNVTAGNFTQIRMNVETVDVVFATDNGTDNVTARVPSEKLKIVKAFEEKTVLTLDFDGKRSLVLPGKDVETGKQKAIFKPVLHLLVEQPT